MRYYSNNAAKSLSLGESRALSGAGLILGADGTVLSIDPDATHPEKDAGLFSV